MIIIKRAKERRYNMKGKKWLPPIITLVVWFGMFYWQLPALNFHSNDFWVFLVIAAGVGIVINLWSIVEKLLSREDIQGQEKKLKLFKRFLLIPAAFALFYCIGSLLSSPIIRSKAYYELLKVETSNFKEDVKEVDYTQIPILDKDSAERLAEREMGSMVDMVSQYEVSVAYNTQINYQTKPVRVIPLEYGDIIKWLTNRGRGIPAYIRIDMTTQDVELVKLQEGMKYSPAEHFGRKLQRYLRFRYPTAMFRGYNFEIDDNGTPYWICPIEQKTIGLFGGTDIKGVVLVNAVTGEDIYYDVADVPQWIDEVYDAGLLIQQYDYYGTLKNGFLNSILGQRDCLQTTEGYNYIALEDDVWVYTGVTSVTGDESNVGFVLMNQRTKETRYYLISGAKEISAMSSAEGQVQHLGYKATFPLLLNIEGEPTYFLALKDGAGLVKKYAMVNIQKYQIVATGDTVAECEKTYVDLMKGSGIDTISTEKTKTITGSITAIKDIVSDGNTLYYIMLDGKEDLFEVEVKSHLNILQKQIGDPITLEYIEDSERNVYLVLAVK